LSLLGLLVVFSACGLDRPDAADRYEVVGVDVSHYQGLIDWETLAADGHDFAFIKATEGRDLRDAAFMTNWDHAGATGMRRGAYHFFRPEVNPALQAKNFLETIDLRPGDLPPVLDVEERGRLSPAGLVKAIRQWSDLVEARYGTKPILYTGQNFYNRFLAGQVDDHPLWLARYHPAEPVTVCGRTYQFWQYSDRGRLPGVTGNIDRNVFLGTHLDLALLCLRPPVDARGDTAK